MFTGIITHQGIIQNIQSKGSNLTFRIESELSEFLKVDQSVSHNGVCLTIEDISDSHYSVTAIAETLEVTSLKHWKIGYSINLELSMSPSTLLDGHIVQGHVDCVAICQEILDLNGSWQLTFSYPEKFAALIIEKGSICINGTSLTCFNLTENFFSVAIIPYTYHHTNISKLNLGDEVNIEFDIIGKYLARRMEIIR